MIKHFVKYLFSDSEGCFLEVDENDITKLFIPKDALEIITYDKVIVDSKANDPKAIDEVRESNLKFYFLGKYMDTSTVKNTFGKDSVQYMAVSLANAKGIVVNDRGFNVIHSDRMKTYAIDIKDIDDNGNYTLENEEERE